MWRHGFWRTRAGRYFAAFLLVGAVSTSEVLAATGWGLTLGSGRTLHTATLLRTGDIFVAGGLDSTGRATDTTAIVSLTSVLPGPRMQAARAGQTATMLASGKVLLAGGNDSLGNVLNSTEIFDPLANTTTLTGRG
jgi:hypothetical protein